MSQAELILIPSAGIGHLASAVVLAELLVSRNEGLSVTVLVMKLPRETNTKSYKELLSIDSISRLRFVDLPREEFSADNASPLAFQCQYIDAQKKHVRDAVQKIAISGTARIAGIVIDMFCTPMIDVANEFGVPSYVFFTSGAASLGLMFYLQSLRDDLNQDITEFKDSDVQLSVPSYVNPVPALVLPSVVLDNSGDSNAFLNLAKRFRETKGIIVNTFLEFESHALTSLSAYENIPPVYSIGPIINVKAATATSKGRNQEEELIIRWLDNQPTSSVVFLCFGSGGSFKEEQVKEIASALERRGQRFLWSLRRPPAKDKLSLPSEYENLEEALPKGFLQRTSGIGKVIGWSPQLAVLTHRAVGGFVSHCGWNSTLESVWAGVPMAAWPLYAEQQANAFQMIKDLDLAVEIKMDYRMDLLTKNPTIITAEEIENGIRKLMDPENGMREKVKVMKEKGRMALEDGGSSDTSLGTLLDEFTRS